MKRTTTKKPKKPYEGCPLENWDKEDFEWLWCVLHHNSVTGNNFSKNRGTILKHYCSDVSEEIRAKVMFGPMEDPWYPII